MKKYITKKQNAMKKSTHTAMGSTFLTIAIVTIAVGGFIALAAYYMVDRDNTMSSEQTSDDTMTAKDNNPEGDQIVTTAAGDRVHVGSCPFSGGCDDIEGSSPDTLITIGAVVERVDKDMVTIVPDEGDVYSLKKGTFSVQKVDIRNKKANDAPVTDVREGMRIGAVLDTEQNSIVRLYIYPHSARANK